MRTQSFTRRHSWRVAAAAIWLAVAGGAVAQAKEAVRIRATIDAVNGDSLSLTTRSGEKTTVELAPRLGVSAIAKIQLTDIKPGSFIGAAAMPQKDGTQRALEVHVFPDSMRGTGEGFRPFDLQPQSTMTNGTVGAVTGTVGRTLKVTYNGGEQTIVVPPNAPIVTFEPGSRAMLVRGAHVIVFGQEAADGQVTAMRIAVGENGLVPPM